MFVGAMLLAFYEVWSNTTQHLLTALWYFVCHVVTRRWGEEDDDDDPKRKDSKAGKLAEPRCSRCRLCNNYKEIPP